MTTPTASAVQAAKLEMEAEIQAALKKFTEKTSVPISGILVTPLWTAGSSEPVDYLVDSDMAMLVHAMNTGGLEITD